MSNGEFYDYFLDACPAHKTPLKAEYDFRAAVVSTFTGCTCAVCIKRDGFKNSPQYFTSYKSAAGAARMAKETARVW